MENLHLKNLIQKPNGLVILKKLSNPNNNYKNELPMDFYKYKLNKLDIDNHFDFEKINRKIHEIESFKTIPTNIITIEYKTNYKSKFVLGIYCSEKDQNKISKIYNYKS